MLVVVDANAVFSALIRRGKPFEVFKANKIFNAFEFVAPEFLFSEIGKRMGKILAETDLAKEELAELLAFIKGEVSLISLHQFSDKLPEAAQLNFKDSPYLALALKLNCPILSGDKGLRKQAKVKILSPAEALAKIYEQK